MGTRTDRAAGSRKAHYVIKPKHLWTSIAHLARTHSDGLLNTLQAGFKYIENESFQSTFAGLFSEINLGSDKLGRGYADRNAKLCTIITRIAEGLAEFSTDSDTLGDAYEYLLDQFAAGSGKKAGEFYTPQKISDILSGIVTLDSQSPENLQTWHPLPAVVPATADADAAFDECRAFADDQYTEAEDRDDPAGMAIWARAYEKARKLALVYAVSASHRNPSITKDAVRWAWGFIEHQTRRMLFMASQHVADGEFDARCKRMVEVLGSWKSSKGDAWMPHWELARRLKWSDKDIEEVRNALRGQRRIEYQVGSTPEGGRVGQRYRLQA